MFFVEDDNVVQTFPTKCPDHPLTNGILPWAPGSCWRVFKSKTSDGAFEVFVKDGVIVPNNVFGGVIEGKGFTELLNGPLRVRPGTNAQMQDLTAIM